MSQMPDPAPVPTPVPVQPLSYATPSRTGRPGIVTAMGVISICFGAWGILSNAQQVVGLFLFYSLSTSMAATTPAAGGPTTAPFPSATPASMLTLSLSSLLNAGLAVFLLVIGIMVLRNSPRGGDLHRRYAWLKIVLAILGGLAYAWWFRQIIGAAGKAAMPGFLEATIVLAAAALQALLGCIYPVALLIALRTRTFREYYGGIRPESAATDPPTA